MPQNAPRESEKVTLVKGARMQQKAREDPKTADVGYVVSSTSPETARRKAKAKGRDSRARDKRGPWRNGTR